MIPQGDIFCLKSGDLFLIGSIFGLQNSYLIVLLLPAAGRKKEKTGSKADAWESEARHLAEELKDQLPLQEDRELVDALIVLLLPAAGRKKEKKRQGKNDLFHVNSQG